MCVYMTDLYAVCINQIYSQDIGRPRAKVKDKVLHGCKECNHSTIPLFYICFPIISFFNPANLSVIIIFFVKILWRIVKLSLINK